MVRERGVDLAQPPQGGLFRKFVVLIVFISVNFAACVCERVAPERCLIWGPGLNPDVVLPVRYFVIQAVDSNGEKLTVSPGKRTNTACV